jgi:hypothetical protein
LNYILNVLPSSGITICRKDGQVNAFTQLYQFSCKLGYRKITSGNHKIKLAYKRGDVEDDKQTPSDKGSNFSQVILTTKYMAQEKNVACICPSIMIYNE